MSSGMKTSIRHAKSIAIASALGVCGIQPLIAHTAISAVGPLEPQALDAWHDAFSRNPPSTEGCFHASYPSLVWEIVECSVGEPQVHPTPRTSEGGAPDVTGNGHDWALGATGLITATRGSFYKVTGVTSETGVGVAPFGGGGQLGPNEYTLQLNSNMNATTAACEGHRGCMVWQQFLYETDGVGKGKAAVLIQYWLLGWGRTACPTGWRTSGGTNCYRNSPAVVAPDLKITDLGNMSLEGQAVAGGHDVVTFFNGTEVYSVTVNDSVLHLGTVWTESEFNVVGNGDGSRAVFNLGAELAVLIRVIDGSEKAPHCLYNAGTTGETNNLDIFPAGCAAGLVGPNPAIEFIEAN